MKDSVDVLEDFCVYIRNHLVYDKWFYLSVKGGLLIDSIFVTVALGASGACETF